MITARLLRVMSPADATAMIGQDVSPAQPTVTGPTVAHDADTGAPIFAYLPLPDVAHLRRTVLGLRFKSHGRSRTFGYSQRRPVYGREGCSTSALAAERPAEHRALVAYADRLADVLAAVLPEVVDAGRDAVADVGPDWRLGQSQLWTSGVVNNTATLPYHRDAFNFPAWSAMPVLRRGVDGGALRLPEYDVTIPCRDGWGVFFAGYDLLHGVTPMRLRSPDGYRLSVVFYALRGMRDCFTAAEETRHAVAARTAREREIARQVRDGEPTVREQGGGLQLGRGEGDRVMGGRDQRSATGRPRRHNLPAGRGGSAVLRSMGGRAQSKFAPPEEGSP